MIKVRAPNGSIVEGEQIDFEEVSNPWSTFKLKDGTTLKVKTVLTDVVRLEMYHPITGEPAYQVQNSLVLRAVDIPSKLRKLPNEPPKATNQEVS